MQQTEPPVKVVIRWITPDPGQIRKMRLRFGSPDYTSVNGFSPAAVSPGDIELLEECRLRGFIAYERKDWNFNGLSYTW